MDQMVEGSLDILWENCGEPKTTPKFGLLFARYRNFRNGAQPVKRLLSAEALTSYLIEISFAPENAKSWVEQLREKKSVSIPNVWLAEQFLADYKYPEQS